MSETTQEFIPGSVLDKLGEQVRANIAKSGVHVWGIFGSNEGPSFTYTTGLYEKQLPEFVIAGFSPDSAHYIIMLAYEEMKKRGRRFADREVFLVDDDPTKALVFLDARDSVRDDYTIQTGQYYQTEDYEVQQILIPDTEGRFPNDPNCDYYLQPILSREPMAAQSVAGLRN